MILGILVVTIGLVADVGAVALGGASKEGAAALAAPLQRPVLLRRESLTTIGSDESLRWLADSRQPPPLFDLANVPSEQMSARMSFSLLEDAESRRREKQQTAAAPLDLPFEEPTVTATSLLEVTASATELTATENAQVLNTQVSQEQAMERALVWSVVLLVIGMAAVCVFPSEVAGTTFNREQKAFKVYCATVWAVVLFGTGFSMMWIGPSRILRCLVLRLPANPGWGWYLGHGAVTAVSIVIVMPIWPAMCMLSGLIFGLPAGFALNFVVVVGGAVVSILLGRSFLQAPIRGYFASGDYPRVQRWMRALERDDDSLMFQVLFRFLFIPFFVRNYAPAILKVPLWKPIAATVPHSSWVSFLFASFGASFVGPAQLLREGKSIDFHSLRWQQIIALWVSFLITSMLGCYLLAKYAQLKIDEDDVHTDDETTRAALFASAPASTPRTPSKAANAGYLS